MRKSLLSIALLQLGLLSASVSHAEDYALGQGWRSGDYYISGYTNLEIIDRFGSPAKLELDDLSLFASGKVNQWVNPFAEIELSKHTLIQQGGGAKNGDVIVERFYNDVILSEQDSLRIGKLLAPLGEWNVTHAAPLVPVISRPYTAARGFSGYIGGVSWRHESDDANWQLYWQPDNELFKRPAAQAPRNFHNVIGGHISTSFDMKSQGGASFQRGTLIERNETYTLLGVNASHTMGRLTVQGEALSANFSGSQPRAHDTESGIYALADYAVTPQWHGIVGAEYYQDHTVAASSRSTSLAINHHQHSLPLVWKLEYIHQAGVSSPLATVRTGLKAALTFMF
mgnify:FL=1